VPAGETRPFNTILTPEFQLPIRITTQKIVLHRDGKRIVVPARQKFEFTAAEMKEIQGINKDALRQPINELADTTLGTVTGGGITNLDNTDANPDASTPAPLGAATSPEGAAPAGKAQAKAAAKTEKAKADGKDDDL
jgi:hypothetical protein